MNTPGISRFLFFLIFLGLTGCNRQELPYVHLSQGGQAPSTLEPGQPARLPLRVAVAAVISPSATLESYGSLLDYISRHLDRPVELIQRGTYAEINELIRTGGADLAFICGGAFVEGEREFGMELLVVPRVKGQTSYFSYIISARDSPYQSLESLRGQSFAFTDPLSNSGHLSPLWLLHQMNETPETFFSKTIYTYSHDNSIRAAAEHLVDGAAVDSLVYDYTIARDPTYSARTRIVNKAGPYGNPPVVVNPQIDPVLRAELQEVFLSLNENDEGQAILKQLMIDRFVEEESSLYDSIREMASALRNWYVNP